MPQNAAPYIDAVPGTRPQAPQRADALAGIRLPDHKGDGMRLGDLRAERPAVLVWLRHYG
jgi:hypothetical protein